MGHMEICCTSIVYFKGCSFRRSGKAARAICWAIMLLGKYLSQLLAYFSF